MADKRYALHDRMDTPAARWPIHMVRTCGIVMSKVKMACFPAGDAAVRQSDEPQQALDFDA